MIGSEMYSTRVRIGERSTYLVKEGKTNQEMPTYVLWDEDAKEQKQAWADKLSWQQGGGGHSAFPETKLNGSRLSSGIGVVIGLPIVELEDVQFSRLGVPVSKPWVAPPRARGAQVPGSD